jgi:hypothetical protein
MGQVQGLLKRLKKESKVIKKGNTNAALWFPTSPENTGFDVI